MPQSAASATACHHVNVKILGMNGPTVYVRCRCGLLLGMRGGLMWLFGRAVG
ncbi:MAG TPA: hypothetical protein VGR51_10240 [Thermoplasmata archaeon]|nr:hypothetical protein [Thermoplasmata archaeon]